VAAEILADCPAGCPLTTFPAAVDPPAWIAVTGDGSTVADLLWARTPLISDDGRAGVPLTHVSWREASAIAAAVGGRLPTCAEWAWMAAGQARRRYPWGVEPWTPSKANLRGSGLGGPTPVHIHPAGATPHGVIDVAGNVWEWTATTVRGHGAVIRGGSYQSPARYASCSYDGNVVPPSLRSAGIGVRVVRDR
jgi:iron(II)-dependent oxidoreductase